MSVPPMRPRAKIGIAILKMLPRLSEDQLAQCLYSAAGSGSRPSSCRRT
jgi:hypothetical protein